MGSPRRARASVALLRDHLALGASRQRRLAVPIRRSPTAGSGFGKILSTSENAPCARTSPPKIGNGAASCSRIRRVGDRRSDPRDSVSARGEASGGRWRRRPGTATAPALERLAVDIDLCVGSQSVKEGLNPGRRSPSSSLCTASGRSWDDVDTLGHRVMECRRRLPRPRTRRLALVDREICETAAPAGPCGCRG